MSLLDKLRQGLARTREATIGKIAGLLGLERLDERALEDLEDLLLQADVGVPATMQLMDAVRANAKDETGRGVPVVKLLESGLKGILDEVSTVKVQRFQAKPWVVLLVGVNGSGKTTTAGKLAYRFSQEGKKCVIAAADTFRAAAVEQVEVWAERAGARLIKQATGADPAAVAFDAYQSALSKGDDVLIVDTAGRLQAKHNLMDELAKIHRVLGKLDAAVPHEVLLVLDATTGQNGLSQARGFDKAAGVTGLIVTKLDGTARAGIVIPIQQELKLPVEFIGLGEAIDDLQPFVKSDFVDALLEK